MATEHNSRNNRDYSEDLFFVLSIEYISLHDPSFGPYLLSWYLASLAEVADKFHFPVKEKPWLESLCVVFLLRYEKEMAVLVGFGLLALEEVQIGIQPVHTHHYSTVPVDSILRHFFSD